LQVLLDAGITPSDSWVKELSRANDLLGRIKANLPLLEERLATADDEDRIYRFYHQSFKVFSLQHNIKTAFQLIEEIGGREDPVDSWYCQIVKEGTAHGFRDPTRIG